MLFSNTSNSGYFRRITGLLLLLCLIAGCDNTAHTSIRFGLNTAPITLDPRYVTDAVSQRLCRLIYQRLVDFDDNYRVIPALAEWQTLSDTHYRFHLQQNRRDFHHGTPLTARDVKATFESILDERIASPHRATLGHIGAIEVIDADTVDFHLSRADLLFPGRLNIGILPAEAIRHQHPFNSEPLGSGALRFVSWDNEQRLVLERIDDGQIIEFITVKDPTLRVLKLARGEIDLLQGNLTRENIHWLERRPGIRIERRRGDIFTYLGFNLEDPVTAKLLVRKAIAHAIDRESIIEHVMAGAARKAGALLPPDHWAGHPRLDGVEYAPEHAIRLLYEAGYDQRRPLRIVFKTSSDPFRIRLATIIQDQLRKVGIDMEIRSYDWGTFYGDIKQGRFQMYSLSWVGLKLPDIFRHVFHSDAVPPRGANRGRFADERVDELIMQAEAAISVSAKTTLYHVLQERLQDLLPYVPLWYEDNVAAYGETISGYTPAADGNFDGILTVMKKSSDHEH